MTVFILESVFGEIEKHALSAYPQECCGVLIGDLPENFGASDCDFYIAEIRQLQNAWEDAGKTRRYRVAPDDFARIEKEFTGQAKGILGIYHSHPNAPAHPSPFDLEHAWPHYAYIILSILGAKLSDAKVWRLNEIPKQFKEQKLKRIQQKCYTNLKKGNSFTGGSAQRAEVHFGEASDDIRGAEPPL